jgi:DNA-binding CsgD family transcriptional regulator/catechol 2,3-dioxygenase-like lactoylglutathione lyase family enzyme
MASSKRRGRPPHDDILTPAEWKTAHAVQHGMTNRQIAERRGISKDAVKFHVENVLGKLGLSNRKALRQWFQPPKGSVLHRQGSAPMNDLEIGPIGQISRSVSDIRRAERWYGETLGLRHLYTFGNLAFFDCGSTRLLLTQADAPSMAESLLYFRVPRIEQAHEELKRRGIEFINAPHMVHRHADGTEEWMAFFKDPEGRPLAIMSQVKDAS